MEKSIVNRERAGKAYRVLPYYLARFATDLPERFVQGLLFGALLASSAALPVHWQLACRAAGRTMPVLRVPVWQTVLPGTPPT